MSIKNDILWFKTQFGADINAATTDTPFTLDMLAAIACQETREIWGILRQKGLDKNLILELCTGDTIDAPKRKAFPKNKVALTSEPNGTAMFNIARECLENMASKTGITTYQKTVKNPDKFCHGFGIFQNDLQHFKTNPDFFLQKEYADFNKCLNRCINELKQKLVKLRLDGKAILSDSELAMVAIAYNTGEYNPEKGLKQGYYDGTKYYGEHFFDFLQIAHTVTITTTPLASPGVAMIAKPTPVANGGFLFEVDVKNSLLRIRKEPNASDNSNIIAHLPDGHIVQAATNHVLNGFREIETDLQGAHFHGYVSANYLKPATAPTNPSATSTQISKISAVYMPRKSSTITKRAEPAGAHSLNEAGQPGRKGTTPEQLRNELQKIIEWLAVDNPNHLRYKKNKNSTFCNIYAHDYCHLAGIYLPRVWWSQPAIANLAQGNSVEPLYGKTIDELRANDLFRWLRDFGPDFGWRRTSTLTKLQSAVNLGAVGLIVARRVQDGKPGHIVLIAPESNERNAKRNSAGEVTSPLQSQAGELNFSYGTGKPEWWKEAHFAESAFWLHE